jgi:Zn-dependent M28 family amino/carboxypeptidase
VDKNQKGNKMKKFVITGVAALLALGVAPAMAQEAQSDEATPVFKPISETRDGFGTRVIKAVRVNGTERATVKVKADGTTTGEVNGRPVRVQFERE